MNPNQIKILTAIMAIVGTILAVGATLTGMPFLPQWAVSAWPIVYGLAITFDRVAHILWPNIIVTTPAPAMKPPFQGPLPCILVAFLCVGLSGCGTPFAKQVAAFQGNPSVQMAEQASIAVGSTLATGSPAFASLAPTAVYGLTALADNLGKPTAVTGTDVAADAQLITTTLRATLPANSNGVKTATNIATIYTAAMKGVPATPSAANAVLNAIATGLTQGVTPPKIANIHRYLFMPFPDFGRPRDRFYFSPRFSNNILA